jgi:cupin 2 domain-containing protein
MRRGNIGADLPDASGEEMFETLSAMAGGAVRIERIVSEGQSSPPGFWYDQEWDEWVLLLRGGAELEFDDPVGEATLSRGDWLLIPARRRHRVRATEAGALWLAVHAGGGNR